MFMIKKLIYNLVYHYQSGSIWCIGKCFSGNQRGCHHS